MSEAGEMVAKTSAADVSALSEVSAADVSAPSEVPAADRPAETSPTEVSAADPPTEVSAAHPSAEMSAAHSPAEMSTAHSPAEMSAAHAAAPVTTASAATPRERVGRNRGASQCNGNNDDRYPVQRKLLHDGYLSVRDDCLHLFRAAADTCLILWRLSPACGDRDASRAAAPAP
jgi:hypothetical protein